METNREGETEGGVKKKKKKKSFDVGSINHLFLLLLPEAERAVKIDADWDPRVDSGILVKRCLCTLCQHIRNMDKRQIFINVIISDALIQLILMPQLKVSGSSDPFFPNF